MTVRATVTLTRPAIDALKKMAKKREKYTIFNKIIYEAVMLFLDQNGVNISKMKVPVKKIGRPMLNKSSTVVKSKKK